jgi:hypothetical protein
VKTERNFHYLFVRFFKRSNASRGRRIVRQTGQARLWHLLRHHEEEFVIGKEVLLRDAVDDLLSFYGVVEVASSIDFVPSCLPADFHSEALGCLSNPAVRRYYEWNYPLPIVNRFRLRLLGWATGRDTSKDITKVSLFYRFLSLLETIQSDNYVTSFLWLLDSGDEGGYDIDDVLSVLSSPKRFLTSTSRRPNQQSKLDRAVVGFSRFLNICVEYDHLLQDAAAFALLCDSMWSHQAYWFYRLHEEFGEALERCVKVANRWTRGKVSKREAEARTKRLLRTLARLREPPAVSADRSQKKKRAAERMGPQLGVTSSRAVINVPRARRRRA